jgi:hypothetical protein
MGLEAVRAKAQKLVEGEKQEMLKRIAIETGKQIDQELDVPNVPKRRLRRTTVGRKSTTCL